MIAVFVACVNETVFDIIKKIQHSDIAFNCQLCFVSFFQDGRDTHDTFEFEIKMYLLYNVCKYQIN